MRLPVNRAFPLAALILLSAGGVAAEDRRTQAAAPVTGPAADYPVVVGEPFTIGSTVYTPIDQLNYDAVGYATTGDASLPNITAAHKTLPLPSYIEVTALNSGKTILVRVTRRGPMTNDRLLELSPLAAAQLGLDPAAASPVRVRRVNPPEQERAMLRGGGRAPERMETPDGLLRVLRRKLADQSPLTAPTSPSPSKPAPASIKGGVVAKPASPQPSKDAAKPSAAAAIDKAAKPAASEAASANTNKAPKPEIPAPAPAQNAATESKSAAKGSFVVQAAAFSSEASARKVASNLGGTVSQAGKFWRVRLGPFTNRAQAAPALEKVRRAGYSDARIQSAD